MQGEGGAGGGMVKLKVVRSLRSEWTFLLLGIGHTES